MRRINAVLTACIMVLFVIHMIWGALSMFSMIKGGSAVFSALSWVMIGCIILHVLISLWLTADTVITSKRAGVSYFKENRLFWVRRISGFALFAFMIVHVLLFMEEGSGSGIRLKLFDAPALVSQILLVAALLVHLITNIGPLKIAFGLEDRRNIRADIMLLLSILLLIAGAAFVVYFIRWQVI